jgi:hypothetical protein
MKAYNILFALIFLSITYIASSQKFVDPTNEWYLTYISTSFETGETFYITDSYTFGNTITIDGKEYYELVSTHPDPFELNGKYYREGEEQVFLKQNIDDPEFLIYDFNLVVGDQIELGNHTTFVCEVTSVDSVTLNSGEKRKQIELAWIEMPYLKATWIEGIGSIYFPMNTQNMLMVDQHTEINCFHRNGIIEYQLGDCMLTSVNDEPPSTENIKLYPNPTSDILSFELKRRALKISIVDLKGRILVESNDVSKNRIDIGYLENGVYFTVFQFIDGRKELVKFYKQ